MEMLDLKEGVELMMVCFITQGLFLYLFKRKVEYEANDAMEVKLNGRYIFPFSVERQRININCCLEI